DHADIYRDLAHYESSFEKLMALMPDDGFVAACATTEAPPRIARAHARCRVETYSAMPGVEADWTAEILGTDEKGTRFVALQRGRKFLEATLPLAGRHNVENTLGCIAVLHARGVGGEALARGIEGYSGVKRRQELRGEIGGVKVIDDFAHHPTAVRETIAAVA